MNTLFGALEPATEGGRPLSAWSLSSGVNYMGFSAETARPAPPRGAAEQWRRALAETGTVRPEAEDLRLGLVYLKSWPAIPELPEDLAACVTRVCALLAHKPTVGFLVGRVLDLGEDESRRVLQLLHRFGHVDVLQQRRSSAEDSAEPALPGIPAPELAAAAAPTAPSAFLGKLWKKLTSR